MKIVYITNVRIPTPRAQGYAIMKMCEEFSRLGNTVELFIPNRNDADSIGEPFDYYKIEKIFEIKKVSSTDFLSKTFSFGRFLYWVDIGTFIISLFFRNVANESKALPEEKRYKTEELIVDYSIYFASEVNLRLVLENFIIKINQILQK